MRYQPLAFEIENRIVLQEHTRTRKAGNAEKSMKSSASHTVFIGCHKTAEAFQSTEAMQIQLCFAHGEILDQSEKHFEACAY
jgi:hypothetical protein